MGEIRIRELVGLKDDAGVGVPQGKNERFATAGKLVVKWRYTRVTRGAVAGGYGKWVMTRKTSKGGIKTMKRRHQGIAHLLAEGTWVSQARTRF